MVNIKSDIIGIVKSFKTRLPGCVIRVVGVKDYVQNFGWEVPWNMSKWMGDKVPKMEGEWK
jgi:hypothetical protein